MSQLGSRKNALVTGAGSGIGREIALRLANDEFTVYVTGRTSASLEETAALATGGKIVPICSDVTDGENLGLTTVGLSSLDVLVANAGMCARAYLDDDNANSVWHDVIDINLTGVWNTFYALHSKLNNGAKVVVVSSGLGKLGRAGYTAYAAAKHGVLGMVKSLALELSSRQICVNAVCPGWVDTQMARNDLRHTAIEQNISVSDAEREAIGAIPLSRFVAPAEVAELVGFLCSSGAAAISGQSYNISCGEFGL